MRSRIQLFVPIIQDEVEISGYSAIPSNDRDTDKLKLILTELGYDVKYNGTDRFIVTNPFTNKDNRDE